MCGIAGVWAPEAAVDEAVARVRRMIGALEHRGPDGNFVEVVGDQGLVLGHARLAIVDLSDNGCQPMWSTSRRAAVVFNGEMYDYIERRRDLESVGQRFRTASDTEIVLGLFERFGEEAIDRLRGMFALALWDNANGTLLLARDRLGKKPLYFAHQDGKLCFASEIGALREGLGLRTTVDDRAIEEYLLTGRVGVPRTVYREIRELPPGHLATISRPDDVRSRRYWSPEWIPKSAAKFDVAVDEAGERLSEAVTLRLRADVPVGVFLSGGIDSGLVTALASKSAGTVRTITVGFEGSAPDEEVRLARLVSERYGTQHTELTVSADVQTLLPRVARAYGEPFADPSAVPSFMVAAEARRYVTVVLNGDGGDELFGGYRRHRLAAWSERQPALFKIAGSLAAPLVRTLPAARRPRGPYGLLRRAMEGLSGSTIDRFLAWNVSGLSTTELNGLGGSLPATAEVLGHVEAELNGVVSGLDELDRIMAADLEWELPGVLLPKMDIATMASGLEGRSPFLDQEIVDWATKLPTSVRMPGTRTKPLLRALASRLLPAEVVDAPKRGFEPPVLRWMRADLRELRDDVILSPSGLLCRRFRRSALEAFLRGDQGLDPARWANSVWNLLMLGLWEQETQATAPVSRV